MSKHLKFQKITFLLEVVFFSLLFLIAPNLNSEDTGFKYLKNYTYKDYDHQPQNWGMAQAENGIIYAANHGGVLEFDSVSWRLITRPDRKVRSVAIDETGAIYIGGNGEIGYLSPDETGLRKRICFSMI